MGGNITGDFFKDNDGGVYDKNVLLNDKRWYVYLDVK